MHAVPEQMQLTVYLAVSGSDHVKVVTDKFEGEASVHQGKATLQRDPPNISY